MGTMKNIDANNQTYAGFYSSGDTIPKYESGGVMIPWDLIKNNKLVDKNTKEEKLDLKELVVYSICLSMIGQSIKNGEQWIRHGNYFCYITNESLCQKTGYSHYTITKTFQKLEKKGYIKREKNRFALPDKIFVRKGFWDDNSIKNNDIIAPSKGYLCDMFSNHGKEC